MTHPSSHPFWHWPLAFGLALAVLSVGGVLTTLDAWYYSLQKPWFQPPDWAFPVAWTSLFLLMAVAGVWGWRDAPTRQAGQRMLLLWGVNALLNVTWSFLYFFLQRPDLAMAEILVLWLSIASLVVLPWRFSRRASLITLPYLVWVSLAIALNAATLVLNF